MNFLTIMAEMNFLTIIAPSTKILVILAVVFGTLTPGIQAAERLSTLAEIQSRLAVLEAEMASQKRAITMTRPAFTAACAAVGNLGLSGDEARAAHEGRYEDLSTQARDIIGSSVAPVAAYDENLEAYYATYDDGATFRMDAKVLEVSAEIESTRSQFVAELGEKALKSFDGHRAIAQEKAEAYWSHRDVVSGRESWRRYADLRSMSAACVDLDAVTEKLAQRAGQESRPGFKERFRGVLGGTRRFFQRFRLNSSTTLPQARIVAHLANPWARDTEKVTKLLQQMGRKYVKNANIELEVVGRENMDVPGRVIIAPSHRNIFVDPFSMLSLLEGPVTVIQTILWFPSWAHKKVIEWTADEPGIILAHTNEVDVIGRCVESLMGGRKLLFFPEGNIPSPLGEIRRVRSGLLNISEQMLDEPLSIVPVTISDPVQTWATPDMGNKGRDFGMKVRIIFDRPIDTRTIYALSQGRDRLLLNFVRDHYHMNLLDHPDDATLEEVDLSSEGSSPMDEKRDRFQELYPD